MLIDMIHDNHGEPPFKTRYRDPSVLKALGYEAIVIPDALAVMPSSYEAGSQKMSPRHPQEMEAAIDGQYQAARGVGMQVFFHGDGLLLPRMVVAKKPEAFLCEDGSRRLCPAKGAVYEAMQDQVQELFDRWPEAAGLVMRTGEVYPEATPHMIGAPLQAPGCAACREMTMVQRQVRFITAMHAAVVERRKMYVHRAWQPGAGGLANMHDDPAVYREIAGQLPEGPGLAISFKLMRGDYRGAPGALGGALVFNPCLFVDGRVKWIEFQCEREQEGKGALPNYQGYLWSEFFGHLSRQAAERGVAVRERFHLWGWSRGGGWGGPYVQREEWIDANVHALAALYDLPQRLPGEIATEWVGQAFGVAESSPPAPAIAELLAISAPTMRRILYVAALPRGGVPWVRDDVLDVEAVYAGAQAAVQTGVMAEALAEKHEGLEGVDRMRQLLEIAGPELPNKTQWRDLSNALAYFHSFANAVARLFTGFARFAAWRGGGGSDKKLRGAAAEDLHEAQRHWQLHTHYYALMPGAPSMFHESGLWERTNACLAELEKA